MSDTYKVLMPVWSLPYLLEGDASGLIPGERVLVDIWKGICPGTYTREGTDVVYTEDNDLAIEGDSTLVTVHPYK